MKILVTGGAGFIGSNIAKTLVEKNFEVVVLDNLATGSENTLKEIRKDITFVKRGVQDKKAVFDASKNVDYIFHEGGSPSSPFCDSDRKLAVESNVYGFLNILNAAVENNVKRVIYASTSSIYGNISPPLKEDAKVTPPNFYAITKFAMENIAKLFGIEKNLETIGFRYMSIYGPNEDHKKNIANLATQFLWCMQKGEQPVLYGDGNQTRDFTYVKDVVEANMLAMKSKSKFMGEILNVGSGQSKSLNELINILNKALEKDIKPKYVENKVPTYIFTQLGDLTKIKRVLGYMPEFSLEDGIKDIIKHGS